jgi:RHS repeat-associated protein
MAYDANDNLLEQIDALGNTNRFTYDARDNKLTETDPLGFTTRYTYDAFNQVTSITNPRGFTTTNLHDANGNLVEESDPLGQVTRYTYDGQGNLLVLTDALGNTITSAYDQFGRLTNSVTYDVRFGNLDPAFTYDANGNRLTVTVVRTLTAGAVKATGEVSAGNETETLTIRFVYDAASRLTDIIYPDGSSVHADYNGLNKVSRLVDPLGRETTFIYDDRGNLQRTQFPDGTFEDHGYDAEARQLTVRDRAGRVSFYTNDPLDRLVSTVSADGGATVISYDAIGRVESTTDENGAVSRFSYAACGCGGRKTAVTNAAGEVTLYTYDANANPVSMTDGLGRVTTFEYDANDRLGRIVFPDGSTQTNTYDALDRQISETDPAGSTTWFAYDARDQLRAVTNALGYVTSFDYDELGNLLSQTDAKGRVTRHAFDSFGQRTRRTLPRGPSENFRYDANGNLTNRVDFNGRTTAFLYDVMNRLTQRIPDPAFGEPTVSFTYTATDLRASMTDASGVTTYAYNQRDWLTNKTTPQGTLAYRYDAAGNVTHIQSLNANGVSLGYEYDGLNRVRAVNDANLGRTELAYDPVGNLHTYRYPNNVRATHQFNARDWTTNLTAFNPLSSVLSQFLYTHNAAGKRTSVTEPGRRSVLYGYDALHRLTGENVTGTAGSLNVNYTYDEVGNRLTRNAESFAYDDDDRLAGNAYDENGNTTAATLPDPGTGLPRPVADQYDSQNRLIRRSATLNGQPATIDIVYDGDGNRVRKTITTGGHSVTTLYLVDEMNPSGYAQVLEELTLDSQVPEFATPQVTRVYAYDYALISQDQLLTNTWVSSFYGYDDHGSVRFLTDAAGNITDLYDYDAFGNLIQEAGATPNNYLHAGEQFDPELGLYYDRARYNHSDSGRFWTRDRFEGYLDDPFSLNPYLYASADPINNLDPSGYATLFLNQVGQWVRGVLQTIVRLAPRFARASRKIRCQILSRIHSATDAYRNAMRAREAMAVAGGAASVAGAGGLGAAADVGAEVFADYLIEAYDLKGLEQYDLFTQQANLEAGTDIYIRSRTQTPCFTAGTLIATELGLRPIETLKAGDKVWAIGQGTAEVALKPITQTFSNEVSELVVLTIGNETIETTQEHPFWVKDEGWIRAADLRPGDELLTPSGTWLAINSAEQCNERGTIYNFEVEGFHTYFASKVGLLVHNAKRSGQLGRPDHRRGSDVLGDLLRSVLPGCRVVPNRRVNLPKTGDYIIGDQVVYDSNGKVVLVGEVVRTLADGTPVPREERKRKRLKGNCIPCIQLMLPRK